MGAMSELHRQHTEREEYAKAASAELLSAAREAWFVLEALSAAYNGNVPLPMERAVRKLRAAIASAEGRP
jgi:hypothetical protein